MKSAKKLLAYLALACWLTSVVPIAYAEDTKSTHKGKEKTMVGCLSKGDMAGSYVLTDEKTGKKTTVMGTADLEPHSANHKVKLTGSMGKEHDKPVFTVSKLEHISDSCQATK